MKSPSAAKNAMSTHFFRRARTERGTCFKTFKMSIGVNLLVRRPGRGRGSAATSEEHHLDSSNENHEIQEEREVLDVVEVILELLDGIFHRGAVAIPPLRPAGNSRLDRQALHVEGNLLLQRVDELGPFRPGPDEAHVPQEHVEELGHLVEPGLPEEAAHPGDPWIAILGPYRPGVLLRILPHGAELVQDEDPSVLPETRLSEE